MTAATIQPYETLRREPRTDNPRTSWEPEVLDPLLVSLRTRRLELGISQAALAVTLATRQEAISEWERGYYSPTLRTLRKWADALGCHVVVQRYPVEDPDIEGAA